MTRILLTASVIALGFSVTPSNAADGNIIDRIEDRIDRRESYIDRQTDLGRRDRIEDRLDWLEDRADRAGFDRQRPIDRWERRSWHILWGNRE